MPTTITATCYSSPQVTLHRPNGSGGHCRPASQDLASPPSPATWEFQIHYHLVMGLRGNPPPESIDFLPLPRVMMVAKGASGVASSLVPPDAPLVMELIYLSAPDVVNNAEGTVVGTVSFAAGSLVGEVDFPADVHLDCKGQLRLRMPDQEDPNFSEPHVVINVHNV